MTGGVGKSHLGRLLSNPRACLGVDVEAAERDDGERPNRQVRLIGDVVLIDDVNRRWTTEITGRYLKSPQWTTTEIASKLNSTEKSAMATRCSASAQQR